MTVFVMKLRQKRWRKCRRQQPGGPAGDGVTGVASSSSSDIRSGVLLDSVNVDLTQSTICWTN